jgi:hypothetical protein
LDDDNPNVRRRTIGQLSLSMGADCVGWSGGRLDEQDVHCDGILLAEWEKGEGYERSSMEGLELGLGNAQDITDRARKSQRSPTT